MGKSKRRYVGEMIKLSKNLKKPLIQLAYLMPKDFTNQMFVEDFKLLYKYLWDDLEAKYLEYKRMDEGRKRKGFPEIFFFPTPNEYIFKRAHAILKNTRFNHSKGSYLSNDEISIKREILIKECNRKLLIRKEKLNTNLQFVQEVKPTYTNYFINEYFRLKRIKPEDVTSRYVLIQEASKYKCTSTIVFLHKVNATERNFKLRNFAFLTLQKFGEKEVRLRKNRKGKKKIGDNLIPEKIETPTELLNYIYNSQLEQNKRYDIFLSHSSSNRELLLKLKSLLNSLDFNVYIDWINDKDALKRTLTNADTAQVIIERLKSCNSLIFVFTEESLKSLWTPWEIGYFHSLNGKICVYYPEEINIEKIPGYINIYPEVFLKESELFVKINDELLPIKNWIEM